ncbi:hypothetical protein [Natranaerobius trueperi]|uniref:CPBP family intramembrane metalloprotease n=1 Tax=Natranaerobius trueperi TaxID=759412 RepID=A0A226BZZ6_9FIRM|nr:hypothetical protein [Natranaerobius trueperi]OWZ83667.1 hypothetical protein CDO51_07550 [Natranaerobius trueperi]
MNFFKSIIVSFFVIYFYNKFVLKFSVVNKEKIFLIEFLAPLIEESTKTTMAIIFNTPILLTHVGIGVIEAIRDYIFLRSLGGALSSLAGHTFFGFITVLVYIVTDYLIIGIGVSVLAHISWNFFIIKVSQTKNS